MTNTAAQTTATGAQTLSGATASITNTVSQTPVASTVGTAGSVTQRVTNPPSALGQAINMVATPVTGSVDTVTTQAGSAATAVVPPVAAIVDQSLAFGGLTSTIGNVAGTVTTAVPTAAGTLTGTAPAPTSPLAPVTGAVTGTLGTLTGVVAGALPTVTQTPAGVIAGTFPQLTQTLASGLQAATGTISANIPPSTGSLPTAVHQVLGSVGSSAQVLGGPVVRLPQPLLGPVPSQLLATSPGSQAARNTSSNGAAGNTAPAVARGALGVVGVAGGSQPSHFAAASNGVQASGSPQARTRSAVQAATSIAPAVPAAFTNAWTPVGPGLTSLLSGLTRSLSSPPAHPAATAAGTEHPVPPAQRGPLGGGESSAGGAPGVFFLLFAATLAWLGLALPAIGRRLRMIRERGAPLAFVLLLDRPG
ncbi:MAG TPA: hypothetical protein VG325_08490 [Solirubrobacteraceae bacterium]|nr:hypothetical protein [Solirubrobacteraceae bacterium]